MTCIVGLEHDGDVWMGGDSAGVSGLDLVIRDEPKVFEKLGVLYGFTTSFRMGQIIKYGLSCPDARSDEAIDREDIDWLCTTFVNALRANFRAGGWLKESGGVQSGGQIMLAFRKRLYVVDSDFQVYRPSCGYHAIGSGGFYALGSLHATSRVIDLSEDPMERCIWALEAAESMNAGVRGPFTVLSTRKEEL